MRYEFERDGTVVASVLWEGPGQVTVDAIDNSTRATVDRYLSSEVVYLGGGFDMGDEEVPDVLQMRRRDWTPWEFERACRNLAHRLQAQVRRVETGPVEQREVAARMTVKGADAVLKALEQEGVEVIFGIPGGASMPIYDPLVDRSPIRHVLCRHEQGAGHAAEGYAWATGKVGVCMATSGPGATQPRDAARRREDGFGADRRAHRPGADAGRGQRRLPGSRHHRHHDPGDEAQLPGEAGRGHRRDRTRGVPHREHRPPRPRAGRPAEGRAERRRRVRWPEKINLPGYRPTTKGNNRQVSEAVKLILAAERPVLYVGGGVIKADAAPGAARARHDRPASRSSRP